MRAADADGQGGDVRLSEADLANLLDRTRVHEGDLVIGADAGGRVGVSAGLVMVGGWVGGCTRTVFGWWA